MTQAAPAARPRQGESRIRMSSCAGPRPPPLGKMGSDDLAKVVPGLVQALLGDLDLDVRLAAAQHPGPNGARRQGCHPRPTKAARSGDTEMPWQLCRPSKGSEAMRSVLAAVAASLQDPDPRIRQDRSLHGQTGLRQCNKRTRSYGAGNQNSDVRRAAGDALLLILGSSENTPPIVVGQEGPLLEPLRNTATVEKTPSQPSVEGPRPGRALPRGARRRQPRITTLRDASFLDSGADLTANLGPGWRPEAIPEGQVATSTPGPILPASAWQAAPERAAPTDPKPDSCSVELADPIAQPTAARRSPFDDSRASRRRRPLWRRPPAAVLLQPSPVYAPPPYRTPGPPMPGTVIARTEQ